MGVWSEYWKKELQDDGIIEEGLERIWLAGYDAGREMSKALGDPGHEKAPVKMCKCGNHAVWRVVERWPFAEPVIARGTEWCLDCVVEEHERKSQ